MHLGQHVHTFRGMLFQKDLDGRLAIGHDSGHPSQVVSEHSCKKCWNKPRVEPMAKYNDQIQWSLEYCFLAYFSFFQIKRSQNICSRLCSKCLQNCGVFLVNFLIIANLTGQPVLPVTVTKFFTFNSSLKCSLFYIHSTVQSPRCSFLIKLLPVYIMIALLSL